MNSEIRLAIERYDVLFPNEPSVMDHFALLDCGVSVCSRANNQGHITGSAYVIDKSSQEILLIFHRSLRRWLQPGGHLNQDEMPWAAAEREALEETGVDRLVPATWHTQNANAPLDFEVHQIPENPDKGEPQHFHYDFRYVFFGNSAGHLRPQPEEVSQTKWFKFEYAIPYLGRRSIDKLRTL